MMDGEKEDKKHFNYNDLIQQDGKKKKKKKNKEQLTQQKEEDFNVSVCWIGKCFEETTELLKCSN